MRIATAALVWLALVAGPARAELLEVRQRVLGLE